MDLYDVVRARRSVRKFTPDPVDEGVLDRLLEAAQWAPSWAHSQCCEVVVVSNPEGKAALQASLPPTNPAFRAMVDAPLVVAFCAKTGKSGFYKGQAATVRGDWMMFDVGLAMQNFMLAAHAEGLATVCVGLFDAAAAGRAVGVPEGIEVISLTPLGHPAAESKIPPRKERGDFAHREHY